MKTRFIIWCNKLHHARLKDNGLNELYENFFFMLADGEFSSSFRGCHGTSRNFWNFTKILMRTARETQEDNNRREKIKDNPCFPPLMSDQLHLDSREAVDSM